MFQEDQVLSSCYALHTVATVMLTESEHSIHGS